MRKLRSIFSSKANPRHPERNEDSFLNDKKNKIFGVFDGLGGHKGGKKASRTTRKIFAEIGKKADQNSDSNPLSELKRAVKEANQKIKRVSFQKSSRTNMGTTATVIKLTEKTGVGIHIGDTRVYLYQPNNLKQMTRDQGLLYSAIQKDQIADKKAEKIQRQLNNTRKKEDLTQETLFYFKRRHILEQALGIQDPHPQTFKFSLRPSQKILLTTDGVHDNLTQKQIKKALTGKPDQIVTEIIKKAQSVAAKQTLRSKADDMTAGVITGF